ncbi:hypothetical protein RJ640_023253 [Escallonia rubra]|uniref:Uncharacterized protein n=1 Tax=Escallonia rubra TaxID=112253 RepID=A0AA88SJZ3_9ASTE|nr:hypothetical protein RJ640_023253 [Escallonia rubra]
MTITGHGYRIGMYNIRVNSINPGLFKSEITEGLMQKDWLSKVALRTVPMRTFGTSDPALTSLVRYLIHDSTHYVSGNVFIIDAGATLPDLPATHQIRQPTVAPTHRSRDGGDEIWPLRLRSATPKSDDSSAPLTAAAAVACHAWPQYPLEANGSLYYKCLGLRPGIGDALELLSKDTVNAVGKPDEDDNAVNAVGKADDGNAMTVVSKPDEDGADCACSLALFTLVGWVTHQFIALFFVVIGFPTVGTTEFLPVVAGPVLSALSHGYNSTEIPNGDNVPVKSVGGVMLGNNLILKDDLGAS